jgi:hypothetical protein
VKAGNRASSFRQIRANTAQEDDVPDAAVADGFHNRFAFVVPLLAEVQRLRIRRQECIDSSRVPKCAGRERAIRRVAGAQLRAFPLQPGQSLRRAAKGANLFTLLEQLLADSSASVSAGTHHCDHRPPHFLTVTARHTVTTLMFWLSRNMFNATRGDAQPERCYRFSGTGHYRAADGARSYGT